MVKKIIPILIILIGAGAGVGAGLMLKPAPEPAPDQTATDPCGSDPNAAPKPAPRPEPSRSKDTAYEYVKLSNQFIIPIVRGDSVASVAIVALSLEVQAGAKDRVFAVEPRLRDSFLQTLFDHAAVGGFDGAFTAPENLIRIRRALTAAAVEVLGSTVNSVLITDIARQDN